MDLEYIKERIYCLDEKRKIQPGERITKELAAILKDGSSANRAGCFAKGESGVQYPVETNCTCCGKDIIVDYTKTTLLQCIDHLGGLCHECYDIYQREKAKEDAESIAQIKERYTKDENFTQKYIADYLDPTKDLDVSLSARDKQNLIIAPYKLIDDMVAEHIGKMNYKDFLKTPYWKVISAYKKYKENYRCCFCGSNINLATHHKTYDRHGYEHLKKVIDEDLVVMCKHCHKRLHV